MEYIQKSLHRDEGIKVTEEYLKAIWIADEQRYPVDYDGNFRSLPDKQNCFYKQMKSVLLVNQHYHCCYCMRRITGDGDTTLEHIVPRVANDDTLQKYQRDEFPMLGKGELQLSNVFSKETNPDHPPYPHTVSYDNLVASCYGLFPKTKNDKVLEDRRGHCCNNVRGDKIALPVFFLPDISYHIAYVTTGIVLEKDNSAWAKEVKDVIQHAQLNWQSLVDIRQLWFVLKDVGADEIYACKDDSQRRLDLLQDNLYLTKIEQKRIDSLVTKFMKDSYWTCFLLYDWFHTAKWAE